MSRPVALITGGASGIGLAAAQHLVARGWNIAILDQDPERGAAAEELLRPHSLYIQADLSKYWEQAYAFKKAFEWGQSRLDLFFANAGIADNASLYKDAPADTLNKDGLPGPMDLKTLDVDLIAVIQGIYLFRHFRKNNKAPFGHVVVTVGVLGIYPNHTLPVYTAAKHGAVGLIRAAAGVLSRQDIAINAICPTMISTNILPADFWHLWDSKDMTPMSTAMRALDMLIEDRSIHGQILELTLEDVIFKTKPEYSTPNIKKMIEQPELWELVCKEMMPHEPGENLPP